MSTTLDHDDDLVDDDGALDEPAPRSRGLRMSLLAVMAVALLVVAGAVGWAVRGGGSGSSAAGPNAVDIGFAQDMKTHHTQAVTMAGYERDNTSSAAMKVLAFDIETEQQLQIGQMEGWLDTWDQPYDSTNEMAWMNHALGSANALMPGMATPAQMDELETMHGKALDVFFLQLMIHHHQGGLEMERYAVQHASESYVQRLAGNMLAQQNDEIVQMEQLLRQLGGTPLPAPTD
jgi:uncharacterized protein (DUF305 family)